jgi:small-conductance mechanosensitive channel
MVGVRAIPLLAAALISVLLWGMAAAQQGAAPPTAAGDPERSALDRIETTLKGERLSTAELAELGRLVNPVRDRLSEAIVRLEPQLVQAQTRLRQLGPAPAAGAAAEAEPLAAERSQLSAHVSTLDAALKQARLSVLRANQLTQAITERRYSIYASELFTRSWSPLDPAFWTEMAPALAGDLGQVANLIEIWWRALAESSAVNVVGAAFSLSFIVIAAVLGLRRWRELVGRTAPATRLGKVTRALSTLIQTAAVAPVMVLVIVQVLEVFQLLPAQLSEIAYGLVTAVVLGAFGRGVAFGVLAPDAPARRLVGASDHAARVLSTHLVAAARLTALFVFLDFVQRAVVSPPVMVVFTSILFALAIAGVVLHLLFRHRTRTADGEGHAPPERLWIRGLAWLAVAAIVIALLAGYSRLAEFLAERLVASVIIAGAFYLLIVTSDALFSDAFKADTPRGRTIAANLGLKPRRVALIGALLAGVVRLLLLLLALFLIIGPWGEGAATDLVGAFRSYSLGLTIGEATISFRAVLIAVAVLVVGILLTRTTQRWLEGEVLARTELEPSAQHSVGMIFGYVGIIVAVSLALSALGIDLQKIAFIAGALSVGIGFGLQSIVSNFVSGLILLTERPIRVGDWIVVKGEEGFVRRIRVRATEIETFERASVIVPNSELISGVVKNWTHGNTLGRITVKVGVEYGSDPAAVRAILLAAADDHAGVLKEPKPAALLLAFGDSALEFELRCIVRDVQQALSVRSELNIEILSRFRAAGIDIPYPQRTVHLAGRHQASDGS